MKNEELIMNNEKCNTVGAAWHAARKIKNQKGITLIALIITIIILLILAGVTISVVLGPNGLFGTAKNAVNNYEKAGLKEEIEAEILNIQSRKMLEGKEFKREDLRELSKIGVEMESYGIPAEGEYKDYFFEIDEKYVVTILEKQKGAKPTITGNVITEGTVLEGTVEIKVTAGISEGKIVSIEATNGAILKEDAENSETEKIFTVNKNGTYNFKVKADNRRTNVTNVTVNTIIEKPIIEAKNVTEDGFTIEVTNNYKEGIVTEFKYYINGTAVSTGTTNKQYEATELQLFTEYNVYVEAYFGTEKLTSETKPVRTKMGEGGLIAKNITLTAPSGWVDVRKEIVNLPLSEYSKIKVTYSFTAGYDWGIHAIAEDGSTSVFSPELSSQIFGHVSVPTRTDTCDLPKDKNYVGIRFFFEFSECYFAN